METIKCKISIDKDDNIILVNGLENQINIDYSGDIDFTGLINALLVTIDNQKQIELSVEEIADEEKKLKLVINTLKSIFEKFNNNIFYDEMISESTETNSDDTTYENNSDLPF